MKKRTMKKDITFSLFITRGLLPAIAIAALLLAAASPALAAKGNAGNPGILPPQSNPHGQTYGEWSAKWWEWVLSIPGDRNPASDLTGAFAAEGQSGSVWFLAGTFWGSLPIHRDITVPPGQSLFFPVINWVFWYPEDIEATAKTVATLLGYDPSTMSDEELLRLDAAWHLDHAYGLSLVIDGVPVQNLDQYRADSPAFTLPNVLLVEWGYPDVVRYPSVSDGYWFMLTPLTPGEHLIQIKAFSTILASEGVYPEDQQITQDITCHITVMPGTK